MNSESTIGFHLRLKESLAALVVEAQSYNLSTFQFFLVKESSNRYITVGAKDREAFLKARPSFKDIFIHCSYWINPASNDKATFALAKTLIKREIRMAKRLNINYLVLHPGSARGYTATPDDPLCKQVGIEKLAKFLNSVMKNEQNVMILLENNAHGKKTIGNDLEDFKKLREQLDHPEKIGFCFDTAHAFSYGYSLAPSDDLVATLDRTMGLENIKLIHFNDTLDAQGSMQDRHAFPGEGNIGKEALRGILSHKSLKNIPKIIEISPNMAHFQNFVLNHTLSVGK